jgi:hypothetical protein
MSYSIEIFLEEIRQKFNTLSFEFRDVIFKGKIPAFFINVPTKILLKDQWKYVSQFVAANFQSGLDSEFSVWNVYLFFIIPDVISDELKYVIENDTFSSRKIVIAPHLDIDTIINEHILNSDLDINPTIVKQEVLFAPNPIVWEYLNPIASKKKVTEEITAGLNLIIEKIKTQRS